MVTLDLLGSVRGNDALFFPLVFLHAVSALAGFGSIGFAGAYASRAAHLYYPLQPERSRPRAGEPTEPTEAAVATEPTEATKEASEALPAAWARAGGATAAAATTAASGAPPAAATRPGSLPGPPLAEGPGAGEAPEGNPAGEGAVAPRPEAPETDPEVEELTRYFDRPARFWKAILVVPVFGLLALWAQPHTKGLDQVWALGALLVWACATLVVIGLVVPALNQMRAMLLSPPGATEAPAVEISRRARLARAGSLASRGAAFCDILFFVALALMIWQP